MRRLPGPRVRPRGGDLPFVSIALIALVWVLSPDVAPPAGAAISGGQGLVAVNVAAEVGLDRVSRTWDAAVADADLDGWPDVMLSTHGDGPARLYRNRAGRFIEVLPGLFPERDRHDCDWGDANADGRPDMFCTLGVESGSATGEKELWIQDSTGSFTNEASAYGVEDRFGRGRRTEFIDANHDPYPDLFVGNHYPRTDSIPSPNHLFINQGGRSFRPASRYGLDIEMGAQCVQPVDYNGDGWQDLLVCGQNSPKLWGLRLYENRSGKRFVDVTAAVGISDWSSSATLVDLDRDGDRDLARIDDSAAEVQLQADGVFQRPVRIASLQRGRWIAAGDADGDGDLDLYLVQKCPNSLFPNLPDVMLLNNGDGTSYFPALIPQTLEGCGDMVAPIDFNRDGRTDFLVLNGGPYEEAGNEPEGPMQLITFMDPRDVAATLGPRG